MSISLLWRYIQLQLQSLTWRKKGILLITKWLIKQKKNKRTKKTTILILDKLKRVENQLHLWKGNTKTSETNKAIWKFSGEGTYSSYAGATTTSGQEKEICGTWTKYNWNVIKNWNKYTNQVLWWNCGSFNYFSCFIIIGRRCSWCIINGNIENIMESICKIYDVSFNGLFESHYI